MIDGAMERETLFDQLKQLVGVICRNIMHIVRFGSAKVVMALMILEVTY